MRAHAIDEVWFDRADEVWVEERLEPHQLVVRYEDRGGAGVLGRGGLAAGDVETRRANPRRRRK